MVARRVNRGSVTQISERTPSHKADEENALGVCRVSQARHLLYFGDFGPYAPRERVVTWPYDRKVVDTESVRLVEINR